MGLYAHVVEGICGERTWGSGLPLRRRGAKSEHYLRFLKVAKDQLAATYGSSRRRDGCLKAWDEFNCCRYTKGWV
jgi:hypothetical protein